ncbi:protein mono-ADP-ribosyltransferase PARP10 isoform X2 [Rhea pennata]|uniref:protein mono-ADP-ribosyltransferase PARP10 isoform X2 n=1 Tax=Rhea pennata TaxID=8795 RepID=UPI002E262FBD
MAAGAGELEVRGAPPELPEELLLLYFESRRRSGGGPVRSCRRCGPCLLLAFENPEDAQRVLGRERHRLGGAELRVRAAAPWDPRAVLLRGLGPRRPPGLLQLFAESVLRRDAAAFRLHLGLGPARDLALVQLLEPLGEDEFAAVEERVRRRGLEGAAVAAERVPRTDAVVVRAAAPGALSRDLLELYFENRRSGGGSVREARVLPGRSLAVVSFQDAAAAERVLRQPHRLRDVELEVSPYYEFLEPLREAEPAGAAELGVPVAEPAKLPLLELSPVLRELHAAFPGLALRTEGGRACVSGGDAGRLAEARRWLQEQLDGAVREPLPFPAQTLRLLRREDVRERLGQLLAARGVPACYAVAEGEVVVTALSPGAVQDTICLLHSALSPFCLELSERELPALGSPRWAQLQERLRCCDVRLDPGTGRLQGLTLHGLEQENREKLQAFLRDAAQDEALVPLEPGVLRYLQRHYRDLLAGIAEVSLLPLEGSDVTGFRLSGEAGACRAAADFLQSLLGTVGSQTVTLRLPGVARFLLDERGQSLLGELERRFQCVVDLGEVAWSPPDTQPELAELLPESGPGGRELPDGTDGDDRAPDMEEIKELLAALRTEDAGRAAGDGEPPPPALDEAAPGQSEVASDGKEDPCSEPGSAVPAEPRGLADGGDAADPRAAGPGDREEEEAAMLLAIQRSMESTRREEEELQRATLLSLRSYEQERQAAPAEDPGLRAALEASLEEALPAADAARVTLYAAFERDVSALPRELEQALQARLRAEEVQSPRLRALPAACRRYLAHLQRAHAVRLRLRGGTATLHGFAEYTAGAARDLCLLLARLPPAEPPPPGSACWVRWDDAGTAVPYGAPAATLLEWAWRRRRRRLDVLFDGQPFAVDLERMEEYDVGAARALAISRSEPPAGLLGAEELGLDEEVRLVPLAEDSEEFCEAVRHFCATLEDLRDEIRVVKYQLKKACVEKTCRARSAEQVLFHGTTEQSSREICLHGFNRSFCGKNATRYGLGVYFAAKAVISVQDKYSPCGADGSKYVFMAKVLTGDYAAGGKDLRAPPLREASEAPRRYDSVVDDPRRPSIFVIFNDTQAYPQYLIACQRAKPPA